MSRQRDVIRVGGYDEEGDFTYLSLPILKAPDSDWNWQKYAQCLRTPELDFFNMGSASNRSKCKMVCAMCPVKEECLGFAEDNDLNYGMWGGYTPQERKKL